MGQSKQGLGGSTYADAGVDISAGNALVDALKPLARSTARIGADAALGGFGGLFDLKACGFKDPVLVAANDGVGTKLKIAIETKQHRTVGIDLVAMSVNDLIVQGAEPLFFLDYYATGKLNVTAAREVIAGIAEGCREAGCALIGGETAEMPGMYDGEDYDLAGFAVGAVERKEILPRPEIMAGDCVLGILSSGPHSNGYSLIRRLVLKSGLAYEDDAPFAPGNSLGQALLQPTRIYVRPLLTALRGTTSVKALAHITGGGLIENVPRVLADNKVAKIDLAAIPCPPVFGWLQRIGQISEHEMLRTFNCGVGMIVVTDETGGGAVKDLLEQAGERVVMLGRIDARHADEPKVRLSGRLVFAS